MYYFKSTSLIGFVLIVLVACQGSAQPLQANAGPDFTVKVGEAPIFDGCASTGDMVNYQWRIISAPDTMAADSGKPIKEFSTECSFSLAAEMGVDEVGQWVVELAVRDDNGKTSTDTVQIEVVP